ncbi:MAG: hypothetical protein WBK55_04880 [Alphaproteobacteria bacterium]
MSLTKRFVITNSKATDELKDPAKNTALPYIVTQRNLTGEMRDLLKKNKSGDSFAWLVKPGDYVAAGTPIAIYELKAPSVRLLKVPISLSSLLTPCILMPQPGIITAITEVEDIFSSEILFSFTPVVPTEKAGNYKGAPLSMVQEVLGDRSHPRRVYGNVFQAINVLKTREDKTVTPSQVDRYIESKHREMMPIVAPVVPANTAGLLPEP